jgi:4-hydroxybenzoate polyprenyltransferase
VGLVRLLHPFPSLLTASVTTGVATLAGAPGTVALRLGLAMFSLQCSIGALNDLIDAPVDARQKPRKPIPALLVGRRVASVIVVAGAALGLVLSAGSGAATATVAAMGLGLGYAYDLRLSRTVVSWLPLSFALPLLPIHAWLGATNAIPAGLLPLLPAGVLGGAGLAIANGLVDVERDASSGRIGVAVALGRRRAWIVQTAVLAAAVALTIVVAPVAPVDGASNVLGTLRQVGVALGAVAIGVGAVVLHSAAASIRERGWELEALGVAALGIGWLAGTAALAGGGGGA